MYYIIKAQFSDDLFCSEQKVSYEKCFLDSLHTYKYWHKKNIDFNNLESIYKHSFRSVEEGKIVVKCQGKTFTAKKGDLIYIPLGRYADINIFAEPNCHGTVLRILYLPIVDILGYTPQVIKMDDNLMNLFNDIPFTNPYTENVNCRFVSKVYKFLEAFQQKAIPYTDKRCLEIQKALEFMNNNNDYSISELAEYCGMNERRFRAVFNKIIGTSPIKIKQLIQIMKAETLLKNTDYSVEEVARMVGFYSPNQLRNVIKKDIHFYQRM